MVAVAWSQTRTSGGRGNVGKVGEVEREKRGEEEGKGKGKEEGGTKEEK